MTTEKYDPQAERWTEEAYADPSGYLAHRADLIVSLGPRASVPATPCSTSRAATPASRSRCSPKGLRYAGVDLSAPMVEAARRRVGDRAEIVLADLNDYRPPAPVACTTCFRAVYYARDRRAFFRHIAGYTERKLVFDLNPRQYRVEDVVADLKEAGLASVELHPFFFPQRHGLPRPVAAALRAAERSGPLARALLRVRFSYLVSASREG